LMFKFFHLYYKTTRIVYKKGLKPLRNETLITSETFEPNLTGF